MAKRMLIDATHPDETRVVVVANGKVEEFDYETAAKAQLKGNIYLAKVTKVEPSLQAAFVDYGGNRHGFLPFSEIHPDYYRIPIADREALLAEEEALRARSEGPVEEEGPGDSGEDALDEPSEDDAGLDAEAYDLDAVVADEGPDDADQDSVEQGSADTGRARAPVEEVETEGSVDTVGGDEVEEAARRRAKLMRRYKIQEVIKRKQVMLVQVTKEERGTKGAALTTYLSLAGRYCVLMPNTAKGGGISRKIANAVDRKRLKSVVGELLIPEGMAVIVRTAGAQRTKPEIRRDYEYLLRLWDDIRTNTLESTAPALIHEEANLIKRAIRDLYARDTEEILVEGDEGYKAAKAFMKMLMPSHARHVKHYTDPQIPLVYRYGVEQQLDLMHEPQVQLRSGGSIVINPTEALVAIDVNSGKATRERHIEETALKTNLEAADEVARQLRLRDFAGLIVIDFIDMEEPRHNREVERRLKEAMKADRARIQLGRISPFGLLELSRQRLRPSLFETETEVCKVCAGTGHRRSNNSASRLVLRALTEEAIKRGGGELTVTVPTSVALFLLNERRHAVQDLEQRYGVSIAVRADDTLLTPDYDLRRLTSEGAPPVQVPAREPITEASSEEEQADGGEERRSSGRRGRRGGRKRRSGSEDEVRASERTDEQSLEEAPETVEPAGADADAEEDEQDEARQAKRRRRGKRGGRRRSKARQVRDEQDGESENGTLEEPAGDAGDPDATDDPDTADDAVREAGGDVSAGEPPADAEPADEPVQEEKPKRRSRRPRRKPATAAESRSDVAAEERPVPDSLPEPVNSVESERVEPQPEPALASLSPATAEPEPEPVPAGQAERAKDAEPQQPESKRRGWWNRIVG
ncbi:Rne/Rng family ribonuclease [Algihabitans albus]|uniref:Rne/Rng family ribonuclease n=1 Tax=Algihabitans albus TaxID=2164067 RepID=UPI000E5D3734|nr:ribonuclease E/G [Algihabitans albus]